MHMEKHRGIYERYQVYSPAAAPIIAVLHALQRKPREVLKQMSAGRTAQQHVVQLDVAVDDLRVVGVQVRQAVGHLLRPRARVRVAVHYLPDVRHLRRQRQASAHAAPANC